MNLLLTKTYVYLITTVLGLTYQRNQFNSQKTVHWLLVYSYYYNYSN